VLWQKGNRIVTALVPVIESNLDAGSGEFNILAMVLKRVSERKKNQSDWKMCSFSF
jgi:hypothetical protein